MTQRHGGASSAEAAQQRRLILPDFNGRIWVHAVKLMLKVIEISLLMFLVQNKT